MSKLNVGNDSSGNDKSTQITNADTQVTNANTNQYLKVNYNNNIKDLLVPTKDTLDKLKESGVVYSAKKLEKGTNLNTDLSKTDPFNFDGSTETGTLGVTGTLPIEHGGTGATTRQDAAFNLLGGSDYTGDLNNNTDVGVFWVNLSNCTNGPASSGFGILQTVKASSGLRQQTFTFYSSGKIWVRTYTNSQWYDWYAVAMLSDEYHIRYKNIPNGADLNYDIYKVPGYYRSTENINKITNMPSNHSYGAFELVVTGIADASYCTQWFKDISTNRLWIRTQTNWQTPWIWTNWTEAITTDIGGDYYARLQSPNNLIHAENEFTFAAPKFSNDIWLNYRTASENLDGNIGTYLFGNGKGGLASIKADGIYTNTFNWKTLWIGKLTSGSATITNAAKYAAILVSGHPGNDEYRVHVCLPAGDIDCQMTSNISFLYFNTKYSGDNCTIYINENPDNGDIDYIWGLVQYKT